MFFSGIFSQFFGVLSTLSDVDVFRVPNLAGFTNHYLVLAPSGTGNGATRKTGYGSTLSVAPVTVTSVDGTVVLASLDFIDQDSLLYVPAAAGQDVLVWIRRAPGAAAVGANDFYSVWHNLDENAQFQDEGESAPGQNDTPATAQELGTNGAYTATHIIVTVLGTLLSPSDVDWYRLDVTFPGTGGPSRYLALRCFGAGMGSGLRWATFALYGPDGTTVLQQETETAAKGVIWDGDPAVAQAADASKPGVAVTAAETWYLRVSTSGQAPDIAGNYYHCDVYLPQ